MKKAWPACVLLGIMLMIMLVMGVFETNRLAHNNASAESLSEYDHHGMFLFDFGNGPVAEGYLPVTNNMIYDPERGYGINKVVAERDRGAPDDLRRDFLIDSDFRFIVDVPNGDYFIRIIAGDQIAFNRSSFTVQGEYLGSFTSSAGQFSVITHHVSVSSGQLEIQMGDNGRINGLEIMPAEQINHVEVADLSFYPQTYVHLAWHPPEAAVSYRVYRKDEGEDSSKLIGETAETEFIDNSVELGATYVYTVTYLTSFGVESSPSNELIVNVIDIDMNPPESPTGLAIESILSNQILISWTEVEDALFYYVYRTRFNPDYFKGTEINTFERIGVTSLPTFTDDDIHSPNPYYYVVRAVNAGGMSEPSEILVANERAQSRLKPCGSGPSHAQVIRSGHKWKSIGRGKGVIYSGNDMLEAMQAAVDSLTPDRTWQEKVVVRGSGTISGDRSLDLPSYTIFEVCGTIHVEGTGDPFSYDNHTAAVRISHAEHISIPYLNITGNPNFGIFIRTSEHIHLGQIDLRLNGGLGIRIDSRDNDDVYGVRHVRIDDVFVSGTSSHGVETYGVDGIEIGTVTAVHTGYSGLLLNDTINASVDIVYGYEAGAGTGYAAFRMANRAGHLDDDYTTNIYVGEVIARGGGRGLFTVSRSGGAVIERVDIARTGNNAILIENGHNIAITGGIVEGPNNIRLAARSEFPNNTNILFENLTVRNSSILEQPCGINTQFKNITLQNSTMNVCQ